MQAHLWNVLPPDVIQSVLHRLPFRDAWTCRSLSCCWASAVRASVAVEVVIPAQRQNLAAKLQRLRRPASSTTRTLSNHQVYTFKLKDPMSVSDCSSLLRSLTKQGKMKLFCQVLIQLLPSTEAVSMHIEKQRLASIVAATSLLALSNIKVCLSLGAHNISAIPSDDVLKALAPVIQRFDCRPVDVDVDDDVDVDSFEHGLTDRQIRALLRGSNCITSLSLYWSASRHSSLHLLANFVNLQHLELHLDEADGLGHLSSVKGLLELHLTIRNTERVGSSCDDILQSNKDSLLHVSLSAGAWDDKTYMGLLRLCNLRTFTLTVCSLQKDDVALLEQLRPSQSMRISIRKVDDHEVVVETIPTLHNLASLTLTGLDLTSIGLEPQSTLRVLTLRGVFMRSTQLRQVVQNSPSLMQVNLHELQGLLLNPDTLCTILQLRHLTTLCLSGDNVEGLTAARVCWLEAFIRAQQSVGMAQSKIRVTCVMPNQTREFCVDYTRYPVLCGAEFDESRANHAQRCWAEVACPGFRKRFVTEASKVNSFARDLAGSRSWAEVESKHPLGILVAVAMLGINVACLSNTL